MAAVAAAAVWERQPAMLQGKTVKMIPHQNEEINGKNAIGLSFLGNLKVG